MKNNLNVNVDKNFDWEIIQKELRHQFGNEIYESWLKKIVFEENIADLEEKLSNREKMKLENVSVANAKIKEVVKANELQYIVKSTSEKKIIP